MPTPTYTPLATVTLGTAAASVTFSSIPATYRDLILVVEGTTVGTGGARLRLNNNSGSNYRYVLMYALASGGPVSAAAGGQTLMFPTTSETTAGERFFYAAQILDYATTNKHKTVLFRDHEKNATVIGSSAQIWTSTDAVTELNLFLNTSTYATGSTFNLYGVIS
jgi:hypothetical protein